MNPQDPLANLQPLRDPALIGWWPPAPGWWLLAILVIAALAAGIYFSVRHYQRKAYRRRALVQLEKLQANYQNDAQTVTYLTQANALLKSVALIAYSAEAVAAQHGDSWEAFLNSTAKTASPFTPGFSSAAYQKSCPDIDVDNIHRAAQHWIKHHRVAL
ncbi:MAG: hypothetical protein ACI9JM_003195 [Halioglobus sp.]